ncbi:glycosyltransferase family 2 protein [Glycomyces harbinensis]|uniref:Glycosyl transferase family 2 n=1 Tax=Glycomyces harbinensis TaxID=58114 RepID=A0A1G6UZL8_9ACTN|nr:glycosyltransferase family A protein [Glycomyces harbinensis]SDD46085.1 Glycosyl transferase family 2 [Glycomyces harbinensis]
MSERVPDVTVVTAVYNTMPYLTACLESLAHQTIGADRFEALMVDDGSTDGSAAELERFAAAYPDVFRVFRQENSGGPAAPSNLALEHAKGRYVIFLGSDDYLGPESLERMVASADEWGSDVLLCKMVGVGGRKAPPVFERTVPDAEYPSNDLAWALSNTKLFRRELIEREGLRFPVDMEVLSDGPFTMRAMAKASKVSILADYDHYFAVKREKAENLTYATPPFGWVDAADRLVATTYELFPEGQGRDDLIYRVFSREIDKMLQPQFLKTQHAERHKFWEAAAHFADLHLTEAIRERLPSIKRVKVSLAQAREFALLEEAIDEPAPRFLVEDGRIYACYQGFRDEEKDFPDSWFEAGNERVLVRFARGVEPIDLAWPQDPEDGHCLEYLFRLPVAGLPAEAVTAGAERAAKSGKPRRRAAVPVEEVAPIAVPAAVSVREDGDSAVVTVRLPLHALDSGKWSLRTRVALGEWVYDLPLKIVPEPVERQGRVRTVTAGRDDKRSLVITVEPPKRGLAGRLARFASKRK